VLPFGVGFLIWLLNQEYMMILFRDPAGRLMITAAAMLWIVGFFTIRKIIHIEV
jgi:tight adherence protein B